MSYSIFIYNIERLRYVRDILISLYPSQHTNIDEICLNIKQYESIMIVNDIVLKYDNRPLSHILDIDFINIINFKNKTNKNIFCIEIKSMEEYFLLVNMNNKFDIDYFSVECDGFIIFDKNINNIIGVDEIEKNIFFENIKTFNINTYIRNIKLQNLL